MKSGSQIVPIKDIPSWYPVSISPPVQRGNIASKAGR